MNKKCNNSLVLISPCSAEIDVSVRYSLRKMRPRIADSNVRSSFTCLSNTEQCTESVGVARARALSDSSDWDYIYRETHADIGLIVYHQCACAVVWRRHADLLANCFGCDF